MKILIASNSCWNLYNFRKDLISTLISKKYKIIIAAPYDEYLSKIFKENLIFCPIYLKKNKKSFFSDLFCLLQFIYIIQKHRPSYSLAFTIKPNIYCSIATLFSKTKMINNITGLGSALIKNNLFSKIIFFIYRLTLYRSYKVVFQNKSDMNIFINKKITNIYNSNLIPGSGININKYNNQILTNNNIFTFLYVGRLIKDKGIVEYLEAAEIVKSKTSKNIKFVVLGSFDKKNPNSIDFKYFESFIDKEIINYLGFVDNPIPVISDSSCVVLPSYREGLSRSLLESMALGKPIITTNVAGCDELVRESSNGFLCKVQNKYDLAEKMFSILNLKKEEVMKMGEKGKQIIQTEYSNEIVINKYLQLIY